MMLETDRPIALRQAIMSCRNGGTISVVGVYGGMIDKFPIGSVVPSEGATGWADSWMLAAKAPHPNCAYMWMRYISQPKVQAQQAVNYGETPDNKLACPYMNKIQAGSCALYHANAPQSYFDSISLWKTPVATCDNGQQDCVPYSEWQQAWTTQVTG